MMQQAFSVARRLARLVSQFPGRRIAVLGDFMLDEFVWGKVSRVSPEAPVPVVEVTEQTASPGGAGNVAANIVAMGGRPVPFGIIGRDAYGRQLARLLQKKGMPTEGLLPERGRCTTVKTRIIEISRKHQVARADRETRRPAGSELARRLARRVLAAGQAFDAVIVSDYDKGTVTPELLAEVLPELKQAGIPVFLDPRTRHPLSYRPVTVITPNEHEAEQITGIPIGGEAGMLAAGRRVMEMLDCPYVLITRGERGMALFEREGRVRMIDAMAQEVYDVTGAGDTVIAALALAAAAGASMVEATAIANCAAGRAVAHVGTTAPTAEEICAALIDGARRFPRHSAFQLG
jgi:rfaE bifunctional protein kinase chain/domain